MRAGEVFGVEVGLRDRDCALRAARDGLANIVLMLGRNFGHERHGVAAVAQIEDLRTDREAEAVTTARIVVDVNLHLLSPSARVYSRLRFNSPRRMKVGR